MVPLNGDILYIDVLQSWQLPVVLCASTMLSTINHSLLSIEALRKRHIRVLGIAFIGERNVEAQIAIREIGRVRWLARPIALALSTDVEYFAGRVQKRIPG